MAELVAAFRRFLTRDLVFVVGGGSIIVSWLHVHNRLPVGNIPTWLLLFTAATAYVVGYAAQELWSTMGIVSTGHMTWIVRDARWLPTVYRWFTGSPLPSGLRRRNPGR